MNALINTYQMTVDGREFLLADVSRSAGLIGTMSFTWGGAQYERPPVTELFYAEDEPLINLTRLARGDEFSNKIVHQVNTMTLCDENIKGILSSLSDNYFNLSHGLTKALHPLFEILPEGIYVCHEAKMIPGDGAGGFFWSSYSYKREVKGTARSSFALGKDSNYNPCFLVPTIGVSEFSELKIKAQRDKLEAGISIGGVAYHLSGMFSALLDGHHSASACLLHNTNFNCVVIEPLQDMLYETAEQAAENKREPQIIALSCPFVKIPVDMIPSPTLESLLMRRSGIKPKNYTTLIRKSQKLLQSNTKRAVFKELLAKAEKLPDLAMIESALAIPGLSDEQLDALLAGEIKHEDEIIISHNYYNSVVTACNYLHFTDFERFLNFTIGLVRNPELTSTHKYAIERLCGINNVKINDFFLGLLEDENSAFAEYFPAFENYTKAYMTYIKEQTKPLSAKQQISKHIQSKESEIHAADLEKMEAIVKQSRRR